MVTKSPIRRVEGHPGRHDRLDQDQRRELTVGSSELSLFRVLWGDAYRGLTRELVEAHDVEEALVVAHERRPELPRPRTAFLVEQKRV